MKKVLAAGAAGLALIVIGLGAAVSMQSSTMHVERSVTIAAAPAVVFPYINDFSRFAEWSPWTEVDPDQVIETSDDAAGVGAWMTWSGDANVGSGKMQVIDSTPHLLVKQDITFTEPFAGAAVASLSIEPVAEGSVLTWSMDMERGFMAKAVGLTMDMEGALAADYDRGLAKLKGLAEAEVAATAAASRTESEEATKALEKAFRDALSGEGGAEGGTLEW
jgi:hypothetical protein